MYMYNKYIYLHIYIYLYIHKMIRVAKTSTAFSNRNDESINTAEFWARTSWRVIHGMELEEAIKEAAKVYIWAYMGSYIHI
jgi:hypothetical protein